MKRIMFVVILAIVALGVLAIRYSRGRTVKSTGENRTATSRDGTIIAFTKRGSGPALIIVDGAFCYREKRTREGAGFPPCATFHGVHL